MSRRTERPYKVDGADKLARHSTVRCSVPEINGPVVQREFTSLLRETCNRALPETVGARVSNDPRAFAGVSRGRSTESNEPGNTGGPHNSGRAELGRQNTTIGGLVPGAMKPIGRALGSDHRGRERVAALSIRTARNRRMRTRRYGGVGGGGSNAPADPISSNCSTLQFRRSSNPLLCEPVSTIGHCVAGDFHVLLSRQLCLYSRY